MVLSEKRVCTPKGQNRSYLQFSGCRNNAFELEDSKIKISDLNVSHSYVSDKNKNKKKNLLYSISNVIIKYWFIWLGIAKPRSAGTIKRLQMYKNFKVSF